MVKNQLKFTFVTVLGTFLEWAEYCIYGYLAAKISGLFFPQFDSRIALIATYGIFAVGFIARPLGGLIFGYIGDTCGRKKALSYSMAIMGAATLSIGLLPTYSEIGIAAPVLLLICRILQGLSVSGEFNGAAIFLIEHEATESKDLAGSWVGSAAAAGMLMSALMVALISYEGLPTWVWRAPFWIGALGCGIGFYLRRNLSETPEFQEFKKIQYQQKNNPISVVWAQNKLAMLGTAALAAFIGINVYICNIYYSTFLQHNGGFSAHHALMVVAFGQGLVAVLIPVMGKIAHLYNGRTLLLWGLIGAAIAAPLVFFLGQMQSIFAALLAQFIYSVFNAMTGAPVFNHIQSLFSVDRRYTGITVAWSISVAIFAGTAPMVAQYWVGTLHLIYGPACYVSLSSLIAFFMVFFHRREGLLRLETAGG